MNNKPLMVLLFFCGFLVVTSMPAFATIEAQGMQSGPNLEPSSILLLGLGILGLFRLGRKKS